MNSDDQNSDTKNKRRSEARRMNAKKRFIYTKRAMRRREQRETCTHETFCDFD